MTKHKLITLPSLQLLTVSVAIYYSQCLIKTLLHGKLLYQEMRALWCSWDSLYNSLKKVVWSLSNKEHSFKFLKISRCLGKNWQDLSEIQRQIDFILIVKCHMEKCCTMKWKPCSGARDSVYNSLKKAVRSLSDHCFRFLKISRCFGNNWQDLSEKRNCFNIKSEVIIIYSTYEHILYSLMHTPQKLWFT